ncbi:hybrid sensor histidine kinase/response regulator [Roseimicrobium sp. ORNL1]|uniref:hybrid sensor histidine kinase/response regulator n=1 Tax=Roseimicrobium sp. ORNL1 TaxID=2711231 RepID=UPI0013E11620|nr:hybrid sensor histidine kinase/response regulator [Roseimicrobium sp. ORNL1]QIF00804.1 HAMP domain-containing histidine kinase [Roseimicrobium sp. ORNL1]
MTQLPAQTILIVDDQEENLRLVGTVLSMMNYDIILASSAEQAYKRLASRLPDLILLDVLMPDVDGLSTCRQIKAEPKWADIPVIFLSAADDKNLIVQALEAGGVDYVTKPFNMAELVSRVRTQLSLKQARDQLRILAEDKDEILGILAHDLKNTLAGMKLSSALLQGRSADLPPRCMALVDNIANSTERMLSFVKEFLANQHAERLQMKKQTLNLGDFVTLLTANHQAAAQAKRITLVSQIPGSAVQVEGDREAMTQVLENLVSNALKFTPPGGKVEVTVEPPIAGMAKCIVKDNGPGFTEQDRGKMFRRYGRLSARPTGDEPSTGLGLSIVKRLLDAMGGSIVLAENASSGAEFIVSLPIATTTEPAEEPATTQSAADAPTERSSS